MKPRRRDRSQRTSRGTSAGGRATLLFIERATRCTPIAVEFDRPYALRPRLVGFWVEKEFYLITRLVATRREHDAIYHRVVTDRGAFDLRCVRLMHPVTLRPFRRWELCAELDAVPISRPM